MASYLELHNLASDPDLRNKVQTAVMVAAEGIGANAATETVERKAWAQQAVRNPQQFAQIALRLALAKNKALTVAQISAAADASLQTAVDEMVDLMAAGMTPGG